MSSFLIDDLALRWIVTALFGVSIAGYVYILVAQHGRRTSIVEHLLHLAMSLAMIVMAWPVGMGLPTGGPIVVFLLAALWFVGVAGRVCASTRDRLTNGYYAVMMTAMAWMYLVMNGSLPRQTDHSPGHTPSGSPDVEMPGMDMSAPETSWAATEPGWITAVNWIATGGFAVAAVWWLYRYFADRRTNPVPHTAQPAHLVLLCQGFMAVGIAIMFA